MCEVANAVRSGCSRPPKLSVIKAEYIGAGSTRHCIEAGAANQNVIIGPTLNHIVASISIENIIVIVTKQSVYAISTI